MLGPMHDASTDVFTAAMSPEALSDDDWLTAGRAAVDLVGSASTITLPGSGPQDIAWTTDPVCLSERATCAPQAWQWASRRHEGTAPR